jgi:hypothetical protein
MSQQYDNTNRGSLGRNKRKETEKHPDFSGKINVEGVDYWLSGWVKEGNGEKFFSLAVKRKDPKPEDREAEFRQKVDENFGQKIDDEIPF